MTTIWKRIWGTNKICRDPENRWSLRTLLSQDCIENCFLVSYTKSWFPHLLEPINKRKGCLFLRKQDDSFFCFVLSMEVVFLTFFLFCFEVQFVLFWWKARGMLTFSSFSWCRLSSFAWYYKLGPVFSFRKTSKIALFLFLFHFIFLLLRVWSVILGEHERSYSLYIFEMASLVNRGWSK